MTISDLVYAVAVKIHNAPPLQIFQVDALARVERVQAGRGQGLMQEIARVLLEQQRRFGVEMVFGQASRRAERLTSPSARSALG